MKNQSRTRLFVPQAGEERLILDDPEILEVARVLRLRPEDEIALFADDSFEYTYTVRASNRKQLEIRCKGKEPNRANPQLSCILVQAFGKAGKNADIVKQATALGVTQISFYRAERSIGRIASDKADRLMKTAIESCRQCGRSRVPEVIVEDQGLGCVLDRVADKHPGVALIALSPESDRNLNAMSRNQFASGAVLVVGPEGGFSREEEAVLRSKDACFVNLGPRVLRMELASVVALSLLNADFGVRNAES
ncbi:MAG: RsmE family RNA methyltransferase [bacterium]